MKKNAKRVLPILIGIAVLAIIIICVVLCKNDGSDKNAYLPDLQMDNDNNDRDLSQPWQDKIELPDDELN